MNFRKKLGVGQFKSLLIGTIIVILMFSSINLVVGISQYEKISIKYSFEKPSVMEIDIDGTLYDRLIIQDCTPAGNPGEPMIPSKGAFILLPPNSKVYNIRVDLGDKVILGNDFFIEPMGQPIPIAPIDSIPATIPNENLYNTNSFYPKNSYTEIGTYSFRGYEFLVLQLHPIQYNPVTKQVIYFKDLTVSIETIQKENTNRFYRGLEKDKNEIQKKVDNPELSDLYDKKLGMTFSRDENFDLLIITTESLKEGFEPLVEAHNDTGLKVKIKTITDIGSNNLDDIRDYIADSFVNWGIEYVLIGGDDNIIPDPYLWVYGLDENTTPYETYMPSDLYYSCLDGPYNYDGDEKWGEPTDGEDGGDVDLVAEVYVGRACVDNLNDVENFVTKTVTYINKDLEDEYLKKYCFVGEYMGPYGIAQWAGNYMDQLIDGCTEDGYTTVGIPSEEYTIDTLYDRDWPGNDWPKSEIINRIDDGIHVINHLGHSSYGYNLKMDYEDVYDFTNNDLCFIYSQGCMAGGFDYSYYDCFAEHSTVKIDSGPFAGIWNARYGWFWSESTDGDSQRFHREFWDAVFGEDIPIIGKANSDSKEDNLHIITRSCIRWCYYQLNLFGDPSLSFFEQDSNKPPETPRKPSEKQGEDSTFITDTIDPEGDNISYRWSWGDGTYSDWLGPYESGAICEASYSWNEPNSYEIRVQAKDTYGATSNWSEPLIHQVYLPVIELGNITGGLFKVKLIIRNIGTADATSLTGYIKIDGDLVFLGKNTSFEDINIVADDEHLIKSKFVLGFGSVKITANIYGKEKITYGYLIGPYISI